MDRTGPRASLLGVRAARHVLLTTALVVVVCAAIGALSLSSYRAADASLAGLTEVAQGTVTPLGGSSSAPTGAPPTASPCRPRSPWRSPHRTAPLPRRSPTTRAPRSAPSSRAPKCSPTQTAPSAAWFSAPSCPR
ncbi:hypothetical protein ACFQV2_05865 [Actinokineospora soli]|uniref:Uncharacterized protein n=1 Tax=Actinokineospora soli TaxID=1048753 RepID=A0ABW2TIH0_9PSEU